jgi:hypothetical protein
MRTPEVGVPARRSVTAITLSVDQTCTRSRDAPQRPGSATETVPARRPRALLDPHAARCWFHRSFTEVSPASPIPQALAPIRNKAEKNMSVLLVRTFLMGGHPIGMLPTPRVEPVTGFTPVRRPEMPRARMP